MKFIHFEQSLDSDIMKSTDSKMNASGINAVHNSIERKISIEEKRSVTNSHKANSLGSSQQLNDSSKLGSSVEHHQHKTLNGELREEDEDVFIENEDVGRCSLM